MLLMVVMIKNLKIRQAVPIYRQIVLQIEEMVKKGELKPGSRIPSTSDFADQFSIARQTAQNALKELTNRGILERVPHRGTFVSENLAAKTIAMFSARNPLTGQNMAFSRLFCAAAFEYAVRKGWDLKLYFPQNDSSVFKTVSDLEKDISDGKIRAVFGMYSEDLSGWFGKACCVPYLLFEETETASTMEYFTRKALEYLYGCGMKKIALVFSASNTRMGREIKSGIAKLNGKISGDIRIDFWQCEAETAASGRTIIHDRLSRKPALPDALLVMDDNITNGVIFALQEKGIRIPNQIALLTLSVKGVEILSPVPLTRIEYDPEELVKKSFDRLLDQLEGKKPAKAEKYHPALITGKSCGE